MMRYVCFHGHFYQPPRENPWLEDVELQDSAYPYHDWNERITAECYAPNTASRILDGERRIVDIVNNYSKISFNFGPTLLAWMERHQPEVYQAILDADRLSRERFSGHGSAVAQVYNHMIMPLATLRDKYTHCHWAVRDFQRRFGRDPEGMWLPETAVDKESLEVLADLGISFTILAPHQAGLVRLLGESNWRDVGGGRIDPTMAYLCLLPSGRKIHLFFYDGPIAREVAFGGLLNNGEALADRMLGAFSPERAHPQIVHVATDGETYGHHHRKGDMALAYALYHMEANETVRVTVYGEYLEKHPKVAYVHYPTLANDPYHARQVKYLPNGAGAVMSFGVKGGVEAGRRFIDGLSLFSLLANVADAKSLVIHPASTTHGQMNEAQLAAAGVKPELIRLSIGLEDPADLIADLERGLARV